MNCTQWLKQAQHRLEENGIGTARLDALVLLEDVTGRDRAWLLAHPEHGLTRAEQDALIKLLNERSKHTPLAYVRGTTEFYGRNFVITPAVLEPRPESEAMIDLLKRLADRLPAGRKGTEKPVQTLKIADVGAGSGALGITAGLELRKTLGVSVDLIEIDPGAAKVAKMNVEKHTTNISIILSDLLANSPGNYDVLLCNLPYVPDEHTVNRAALHEPGIAIFGGPDGLDIYRKLFDQVRNLERQPLYILTEALPPQHNALAGVAGHAGYRLVETDGFVQLFAAG